MRLLLLLSLVLVFRNSFAQYNPLKDPNICGRPTCKDGGKFRYKKGIEHSYRYKVNITTLFEGTSKNESTLYIDGVAYIDIISPCDGLLTLTDIQMSDTPIKDDEDDEVDFSEDNEETNEFSEAMTSFNLRFSFHDGVISEVCPEPDEKNWVLNFKKGLLSMLHNTMKRLDLDHQEVEDDVHGKCMARYSLLEPNGTALVIEKTKDLSSCESRSTLHSAVQSTPYNFKPKSRESNLLRSWSRCVMSIDHYVYRDISCVESHIFQPFSNQDSGAATIVKQSLTLIDKVSKEIDEQSTIEKRTPLAYDPVPTPKPTSGELKTSRELITKLCKLSTDDVQIEFSDLFTKFIHTSRLLSYPSLSVLYKRIESLCPSAKKHVLDAIPYLGSAPSIRLMKKIILDGSIPPSTVSEWMVAIALIPRPDIDMLTSAHALLKHKFNKKTISLGVASMTHTFCKQNPDCTSYEPVDGIIQILEVKTTEAYASKTKDRKIQEQIIVSLKSLSNIGIVREGFQETVNRIIEDGDLESAIRVAGVETYRRSPCEETQQYFESLFRNMSEDTEVRIAAYLQVMRCPNYVVVGTIRHSLEVEEVNQVGSFIWSHLHNLLKSSIPSRVEIQSLLSDRDLVKKFSNDVRKFSNNYEGSVFFEEYNVGANYESNVIFSPSSYIPRSAMANVTVDLFGESINLLEVYGRFEGFERYLESKFGPKGPYSGDKILDKLPRIRWPRHVTDAKALKSEIDKYSDVIDNNFDNPKVAVGMKIFGNDLKYKTFNGEKELMTALSDLNLVDHLKRILSGKEIKYNKAAMFLDSSYIVPTGAGIPLTLNAVGTAAINLKLWGSLSSINSGKNMSIDLTTSIEPNVALDIIGTMSVDAYYSSTGIKLKTSLYTSSAVESKIAVRGSKHIRVTFGLPKQTTEIIGAKSEIIVMKGSLEEKQSGLRKNKVSHSMCSWPAVERTIGLKLCADYHFVNVTNMKSAPNFILAGPSEFKLGIQKMDPMAKTYLMEYRYNDGKDKTDISFIFETPGATISRVITFNITHNNETGNITLNVDSTAGNFLARGKYKNTDSEKYLDLGLDVNRERKFGTLISLQKESIAHGFNYTPKLILNVNKEPVAEVQGSLKWVDKFGVSQWDVNLKFKTKRLESKLFGYVSKTLNSFGTNLVLNYQFTGTKVETVKMIFDVANKSKDRLGIYIGNGLINTTAYPNTNFNSTFKLMKSARHTDFKFDFEYGPSLFKRGVKQSENLTTIMLSFEHTVFSNGTRYKTWIALEKPATKTDMRGEITWNIAGHVSDGKLLARYAPEKEIIVQTHWYNPKQPLKYIQGSLNITVPEYTPMILEGHLKEQKQNNYEIQVNGVWFTGQSVKINGIYFDNSDVGKEDHHLKMVINSSSFEEIICDVQFYMDDERFKIDLKGQHKAIPYELFFEYDSPSSPAQPRIMLGRITYRGKVYSFVSSVSLTAKRQIKLELHIDQLRDIHLAMWGHNDDRHKALGFEVKWDANRDPNQKLEVTVDISNSAPYNYMGNFIISYPGRMINGRYSFLWEVGNFKTLAWLSWSPEDAFMVEVGLDYRGGEESYIIFKSQLLTPFEDLRRTALNAGYHHMGNMYRVNGSIYWQHDQHIAIDLYGDYSALQTAFECEVRLGIASTIRDVPSLTLNVRHHNNATQLDSNLYVMYDPKQVIDLTSSWKIDGDERMKNLTGTVTILTPFNGFNKGLLVSKIYVTNSRSIKGAVDLDIDHRKFTALVKGDFQRLTKSMLSFNVTTPFEKYNKLSGRFGFMEDNKHLVAMIHYPSGSTGIEIKLYMKDFSDFDVILNVATPLEFIRDLLVRGKRLEEEADFRLRWNSLLLGFTGVWHYANVTDFEHSYKIYTPLDGYEENGVVAKLIFKEGLDFELSIQLAKNRLGITVEGKPKPKFLKELGIETQQIYKQKLANGDGLKQVSTVEEDPVSWEGFVEIDTLLYPTMKGTIDIDQKGTVYDVLTSLTLPKGKAELRNEFDYRGKTSMKNRLYLTTPYVSFKTITSNFALDIVPGNKYLVGLDFNYENGTQWIQVGAKAHYISPTTEDENVHNLTLHLHTPSPHLPLLDFAGTLEIDTNFYSTNFTVKTKETDADFDGNLKFDSDRKLEADVKMSVKSPVVKIEPMQLTYYRELIGKNGYDSNQENKVKLDFTMRGPRGVFYVRPTTVNFATTWRYETVKAFKVNVLLDSSWDSIPKCDVTVETNVTKHDKFARANVFIPPLSLNTTGRILYDKLDASFQLGSLEHVRYNYVLDGKLVPVSEERVNIQAVLSKDGSPLDVTGFAEIHDELISKLQLDFTNSTDGKERIATLTYDLVPYNDGYAITTKGDFEGNHAKIDVKTAYKDAFDWYLDLKADTSHNVYKYLGLHGRATTVGTNRTVTLSAETPFEQVENPRLGLSLDKEDIYYKANGFFELTEYKGWMKAVWSWVLLENMDMKLIGNYQERNFSKGGALNAHYLNPRKTFESMKIGTDVHLNQTWGVGANLTLSLPGPNKIDLEANVKLSPSSNEVHSTRGKFYALDNFTTVDYLARYRKIGSDVNYGSTGKVLFGDLDHLKADVDLEWGKLFLKNHLQLDEEHNVTDIKYSLRTPKFKEEAIATYLTYKKSLPYHNISCEVFHPGNRSVAKADIDFMEFGNMNGTVNVTTPFPGFNYTGAHFITETNSAVINRFIQVFWPNNTAALDSKCTITTGRSLTERQTTGVILAELPLATRHVARVDYDYTERGPLTTGEATVEYNRTKVLEGKYNCRRESRAGFEKDTIHLELKNEVFPIGADYEHKFEYSAPGDGSNIPTVDTKWANVYNLHNRTALNMTGKFAVGTSETGRQISVTAIHSNRTVKFWTNYDMLDQEFKQQSRIELDPKVWLAYEIDLLNRTMDETAEAQQIQINLSYPKRNFTGIGAYNITEAGLSSDLSLEYGQERKTVQGGLEYKRDQQHPNRHELRLDIKHPSFEKNVTLQGGYESMGRKMADFGLVIDYSHNPDKLVKLRGLLENHSENQVINYTYSVKGGHPETKLSLDMRGGLFWRQKYFISEHFTDYTRTFDPQTTETIWLLDLENDEVKMKKKTPNDLTSFWGRYRGNFPLYTANMTAVYGNDIDASGEFYLNFNEKLVRLEMNKTTDGSQCLKMFGLIPDARSAFFDIWRNYDDIRISDVSYLLRLNHSRLFVSNLQWRPELKEEIRNGIRTSLYEGYNRFTDDANNARQYIRNELKASLEGIWKDASRDMHEFLDDVKGLSVIGDDLEHLKIFLNSSYYANDFYIRDVVNFLKGTLDELSLRSHIESLPAIVNEIWVALGDSGKKLHASIMWVIEKVKTYYQKSTEFINGILQGKSSEALSDTFKDFIEKYDNYIKEMHVSFIRYVEDLWSKTIRMLANNWHRALISIEPTFIKIIHYVESIVWSAGQEFVDFLYMRKSEILASEYFGKFANISHDVDKFYKEITGNDTIGAVYKYSKIMWNFVKQKYFEVVPFARELEQVSSEILDEIKQLKNLPVVRFFIQQYEEVEQKVEWFANYFDVQNRVHRFITLIRLKLTDMKYNALETENRYREAKTKFIFEPSDGVMYLEQKLPMSWHAFNETPKFDEIPEYKKIRDIQKYFATSKLTFASFYTNFKPLTEPTEWLPPFKAQAALVRGKHFITFDRVVYDFRGDCTYLLANDFRDGNFSIAVSYNKHDLGAYRLLILLKGTTLVDIDLQSKIVTVDGAVESVLPTQIGDAYIHQEADIVTLESEFGFRVQCNMKFDVCMFEVSGWYFGKTAGLWGTMNNEPSDDFLTSEKQRGNSTDLVTFADSWSLDPTCTTATSHRPEVKPTTPDDVRGLCEFFFASKVSPFITCFPRVPAKSFLTVCLSNTKQEEVCSIAISYMDLCAYESIPLRIPDKCVKCALSNGTEIPEGTFIKIDGDDIPRSADVVFIVEGKKCNSDVRSRKRIDTIVEHLEKELYGQNITRNRYAVLTYGNGLNVYSRANAIVINNTIFAENHLISKYFDHIKIADDQPGYSDVFSAILTASELMFRPGVSKTFVLLPCADCFQSAAFDYSFVHQLLEENGIALHILMNEDLQFKKTHRHNKTKPGLLGFDGQYAFTKKDVDSFKGDRKLKKDIQLPKQNLGFCLPLAMESNGSVFSAKKLIKLGPKAAQVYAKRIAQSALAQQKCKTCECTGHNTGVSYLDCLPCEVPTPHFDDWGDDDYDY